MIIQETFKDIPGYEGLYQVSDFGRVKSLATSATARDKYLKYWLAGKGYPQVKLCKDGVGKNMYIHTLVAMAFLGHTPDGYKRVIDHIDGDKLNNFAWNIRIVSNRENLSGYRKDRDGLDSKYTGVSKATTKGRWVSKIYIDGEQKYLGTFGSELEAANAYKIALASM